jgi:ribosomal protein S18 acetylase RimI-like enzyme
MQVRPLTESDIGPAARILADAHLGSPVWRWVVPDEAERRALLPDFMRVRVRFALLERQVFGAGDPLSGVAIWEPPHPPERRHDLDPDGTRTGYADLRPRLTDEMMARFAAMDGVQRPARALAMGGPSYWYLSLLGVDPAAQRSGAGRALIADMCARLDAAAKPCVTDTSNAANIAYYEQRAFRVVHHGRVPLGGPEFWTFRRDPAS